MANALAPLGSAEILDTFSEPSGNRLPVPVHRNTPKPAAKPASQPAVLTRDLKAAVIVRLLLGQSGGAPLRGLEARHQTRLIHAMSRLRFIDAATTEHIIREFLAEFDSLSLYFPAGLPGALDLMRSHLDPVAAAVFDQPAQSNGPADPWSRIEAMEPTDLAAALAGETPPTLAVVLSRLSSGKAAELLNNLDPDLARAAALAAAQGGRIDAAGLAGIGAALTAAMDRNADQGALPGDPVARVGNILNFVPAAARDGLLDALESSDADLAERMRRIMFTFADIPDRVEVKDVPKVVRAIDNETLVTALAGARGDDKEVVDFLFANLSKRLAEQLADEMRETGEVKVKDADRAMNRIISAIRDLEASGEITLITEEE
ncbi:MAG: flagellar motor switch protein FliG [Rhodobacteraceae bacterium]|nr:flagellar motor switch protein FliG [Paracoccaceae bacterium]